MASNNYFSMFVDLIDYSCKAADELSNLMRNYPEGTLKTRLHDMHAIEHAADEAKHAVMEKLSKEFITPIEREDIMQITSQIDDITDAIEDVVLKAYMYHVTEIKPEALEFTDLIVRCCQGLKTIFSEFHNFKRSKELNTPIVEVNELEEVGDRLYVDAVRKLYVEGKDPLEVIAWTEVFSQLESCLDICEDTADIVKEIVMKNT